MGASTDVTIERKLNYILVGNAQKSHPLNL